ncbi:MAG: hypothetical protein DRP85_08755, partial [Candidatus Makaraimicrobium thalassicum]
GHVLDILKQMPDEFVDCVVTSPPYWGLRDYNTKPQIWDGDPDCDHEFEMTTEIKNMGVSNSSTLNGGKGVSDHEKIKNIKIQTEKGFCKKCGAWKGSLGLEPDFKLYIQHLKQIFAEVKRVLKKEGTCWVNLGDTYSGSWGNSGNRFEKTGISYNQREKNVMYIKRNGSPNYVPPQQKSTLPPKCLVGIPQRFVLMMIDELGWTLRNQIIWYKLNCIPESATDRFTRDFEHVFFFTKSRKYYFEQQFEPVSEDRIKRDLDRIKRDLSTKSYLSEKHTKAGVKRPYDNKKTDEEILQRLSLGRNKRCVWVVNVQSFKDAHFAVYPEKLVEIPIRAGCPEYICRKCNTPRVKIYKRMGESSADNMKNKDKSRFNSEQGKKQNLRAKRECFFRPIKTSYSDCGCNAGWKPGIVLDPFFGSGTTGLVALKLNRNFIGIELNPDYIKMAMKRIKPYLEQTKISEFW